MAFIPHTDDDVRQMIETPVRQASAIDNLLRPEGTR